MSLRQIMSGDEVSRALTRMGHEIVEKHGGAGDLALIGIEHRGPALAARIGEVIADRHGIAPPVASIDPSPFRDDLVRSADENAARTDDRLQDLPFDLVRSTVVLVDDVLFTGRTVRAAIDALVKRGRPAAVRLAVLVDRGHRELPIRADHVGKNVPTARGERIEVRLAGDDGVTQDSVHLIAATDEPS